MASPFLSRKFLLTLGALVFTILTEIAGIAVSQESFNMIWALVIGYVGVEGAADIVQRNSNKEG